MHQLCAEPAAGAQEREGKFSWAAAESEKTQLPNGLYLEASHGWKLIRNAAKVRGLLPPEGGISGNWGEVCP